MQWNAKNIIGIVLLIVAFALWLPAIGMASRSGFFENELAVQLMVLGGATSMVAGAFWALW